MKLVIAHLIALIIAQGVVLYSPFATYFSKVLIYEGVGKIDHSPTSETIDSTVGIWYDRKE